MPVIAPVKKRLLCMIYDAVLLFGITFSAVFVFKFATQRFDDALMHRWLQLFLFIVIGMYFTYVWGRKGQTLAMQAWHLKIVTKDNNPITFKQACIRYCGAWMWFLPALILCDVLGIHHWDSIMLIILVGMVAWAMTVFLDENRQFLHDKLAGTQIILLPKKPRISDTE